MEIRRVIFIFIFLLLSSQALFGKSEKRVLIYYFKNISGEEEYSDLMYKLPIYIYTTMKENIKDREFSIIEKEGLQKYLKDDSYDLWDSKLLLNIAQIRSMHEVIFGQFYIENEKPVVLCKIFFIKNGLILDLNEENEEYYEIIKGVENLSVESVRSYNIEKRTKFYTPGMKRMLNREKISVHHNFSVLAGVIAPMFEWSNMFPIGIYGEASYSIYPKVELFPIGFGLDTGFVYMMREADENYKQSQLILFPIGASIKYLIRTKGFVDGLVLDFGLGMGISRLYIEENMSGSVDLYMRGSFSVIVTPMKDLYLSLKTGYMSIAYKDFPMETFFGNFGVIFYF